MKGNKTLDAGKKEPLVPKMVKGGKIKKGGCKK